MRSLLPLSILLIPIVLSAQAPATGGAGLWDPHHFLWFTGHWNKSAGKLTFVIDRSTRTKPGGAATPGAPTLGGSTPGSPATPGASTPGNPPTPGGGSRSDPDDPPANPPDGGTITINPDGTVNLTNGGVNDWNKKMDKALQSEQQYLQDLQDPGDNLDPTAHHLHQLIEPDVQQRVNDINSYKIDPKQDILGTDGKQPPPPRTMSDLVADACRQMRPDYDMVMNYYKTQVRGHSKDLQYPAPPSIDYDCYSCDSNIRKQYDTTIYSYVRDFGKEEDKMVTKGLGILHEFGLMGISAESGYSDELSDAFAKHKNDPSKAGACAYVELSYFSDAVYAIAHHLYMRAEKMVYDNKNNWKAAPAIIRTYLTQARAWALRSGNVAGDDLFPLLSDLAGQSVDHYINEFNHDDWRQIGNIVMILQMIRDEALMGGQNDSKGMDYLSRLLKIINGFELTVEMDIKIGKDAAYKLAHLKGKCHIIPSFRQDSNQCYKWVVADENNRDILGFYKAKNLQSIDCDVLAIQIVSPPQAPRITYTGTKKYTAPLMSLSMDFCHPGHDTIVLGGFVANPPAAGTWLYPHGFVSAEGVTGMEQFFEDINAKKKMVDDGEAQKAQNDLRSQAEKLKARMEALRAQMGAAHSGAQAGANYEKMMELKDKMISQLSMPTASKLLYLDFLLPVKNNEPVLVHNVYDAKKINPQEQEAVIYGYYTIHIENDGNGKPKSNKPGASGANKK